MEIPEPHMLDAIPCTRWEWATRIKGPGSVKFKATLPQRSSGTVHMTYAKARVYSGSGKYVSTHKGKAVSVEALKVWRDPHLRSLWLARHNAITRFINQ